MNHQSKPTVSAVPRREYVIPRKPPFMIDFPPRINARYFISGGGDNPACNSSAVATVDRTIPNTCFEPDLRSLTTLIAELSDLSVDFTYI
jgi:hypothetical protein